MLVWHYVLHDLPAEAPYLGGVYWGKLVFPKEYPLKPPSIYMLTPSGRFETNARLCLSMSDFHPESWNPSWRIESILLGLVSFMLDPAEPRTAGGIHASPSERRQLARLSFDFNRGNSEFRDLFPEFCNEAKKRDCGAFFLEEPSAAALRVLSGTGAPLEARANAHGGSEARNGPVPRPGGGYRGLPATLLALSMLVLLVSCAGLFLVRSSGGRGPGGVR